MFEVIKRFLDNRVVSFISEEFVLFWAMFALGWNIYINDNWVILYLTGLNYYGLLKPFFPYIDVYVFAMWFYITSDTKKSE